MTGLKLSLTEKITLVLMLLILLAAFALFYFNYASLDIYLEEDGLVEWLTVAGLLAGFFLCINRFIKLLRIRSWWFLTVNIVLGLLLFIAAGEEISWGQRILGIKSSEYFLKHNAQGETNIHNLVVNGVKINKLVFSTILIAMLGVYLVILPLLYRFNDAVKKYINNSGVPVPRLYQIISFLLVFAISGLLKHDRNPELLECGAAALLFLIIYNPLNKFIYYKNSILR
jgi:hypothetical protein